MIKSELNYVLHTHFFLNCPRSNCYLFWMKTFFNQNKIIRQCTVSKKMCAVATTLRSLINDQNRQNAFISYTEKQKVGWIIFFVTRKTLSRIENCLKINMRSSFIRDLRVCDSALSFLVGKALQLSPPFRRECPISCHSIMLYVSTLEKGLV